MSVPSFMSLCIIIYSMKVIFSTNIHHIGPLLSLILLATNLLLNFIK